jgi:eukaryotic-like serine/threonine-protein kinase
MQQTEKDLIAESYEILELLGEGGIGTTYKAIDRQTNQPVAIKIISLRQISGWKSIDLFQREVRVLKQLNHSAIPKYLGSFERDTENDRFFYIVQALAPGQTLAQQRQQGWQPNESEVQAIAVQILEILIYLQTLTPPIIHRDLKPQNILRDEHGKIYLVDFGAVQDTYRQTVTGGSTVVGTFGYMAPEQFRGQATLATDLYGLGATLIFLLSGKDPIDLPQTEDLKLNVAGLRLSADFRRWLDRLIEPAAELRFQSAESALLGLQGQAQPFESQRVYRPKHTKVTLIRTDEALKIEFFVSGSKAIGLKIGLTFCVLCYLILLADLLFLSSFNLLSYIFDSIDSRTFILCFGIISGGLIYSIRTFLILVRPTILIFSGDVILLKGIFHPFRLYEETYLQFNEIHAVCLERSRNQSTCCVLQTTGKATSPSSFQSLQFGSYLSLAEQRWLIYEVQTVLQSRQNQIQQYESENQQAEPLEPLPNLPSEYEIREIQLAENGRDRWQAWFLIIRLYSPLYIKLTAYTVFFIQLLFSSAVNSVLMPCFAVIIASGTSRAYMAAVEAGLIPNWTTKKTKFWFVKHRTQQQVIACASLTCKTNCSVLDSLFVHPDHRRQAIGSRLVLHLAQKVTLPLYLNAAPGTEKFYDRLGFVPVSLAERKYGTLVLRQILRS